MSKYKIDDYRNFGENEHAPYNSGFLAACAMTLADKRRLKMDLEQMIKIAEHKEEDEQADAEEQAMYYAELWGSE